MEPVSSSRLTQSSYANLFSSNSFKKRLSKNSIWGFRQAQGGLSSASREARKEVGPALPAAVKSLYEAAVFNLFEKSRVKKIFGISAGRLGVIRNCEHRLDIVLSDVRYF